METNRELDWLVAKEVFGKQSCVCCHGCACDIHDCPAYSTDPKAVREVLEKLKWMWPDLSIEWDGEDGCWIVHPKGKSSPVAIANSFERAVCEAALKAVESPVGA